MGRIYVAILSGPERGQRSELWQDLFGSWVLEGTSLEHLECEARAAETANSAPARFEARLTNLTLGVARICHTHRWSTTERSLTPTATHCTVCDRPYAMRPRSGVLRCSQERTTQKGTGMIDKRAASVAHALEGLEDGATLLISGFGGAGVPDTLIQGVLDVGARDLTIVTNNAGSGDTGVAALFKSRRVAKIICSYPRSAGSVWFERRYLAGEVELELVPQGTLSERLRAAGAGIGGFFTPTAAGTDLARGKETRLIGGREHVFESPLAGDLALVRARRADRWGNLDYRTAARNYGPTMATAGALTVVEVEQIVELGELDPECIVTPGIFVNRVIEVPRRPA